MFRRTFVSIACGLAAATIALPALASTYGTKDEALALARKAVAHYKSVGKDKAFADFNNKTGGFVDRDLYVFVFDAKGTVLSHGANEKLIGRDLMQLKDADGKVFVKDMMDVAKAQGKGWVDYKWPNPVTKQIEAKSTYVEKADDVVFGVGIYKQ